MEEEIRRKKGRPFVPPFLFDDPLKKSLFHTAFHGLPFDIFEEGRNIIRSL